MHKREAPGVFIEIRDGIFPGDTDPAEIHLHGDEFGIRFGEKKIVRKFAAERIGWLKFEGVIVVAELDAGFLAFFAGFVEEIRCTLPSVGPGALFFVDPGTNDIAVANNFRSFESFGPFFLEIGRASCREREYISVL